MSKQANTKLIGGFVVGAIALIVAGILLFGSVKFLSQPRKFVLFFTDSLSGLHVGAPVDFRGVRVGTVTDIKVVFENKDLSLRIPVFIQIEPERITFNASESELKKMVEKTGPKNFMELLINQGLKAKLEMTSLVTGLLGIQLDFFPDKPIVLAGAEPGYTEIPTVESSLSEIAKTVQNIPVAEIAERLLKTLEGAEKVINSPEIMEIVSAFHQTIKTALALIEDMDKQVKPLAANAGTTLVEARKMLENAQLLARNLDSRIPQFMAGLEKTFKSADTTMQGTQKAIDGIAGENSPVRLELIKTLDELTSTARSLRILADYLQNHPEDIVRGKGK